MIIAETLAPTQVRDVVIIGAGFGGIGLALELNRRGIEDYIILERGSDVGGTWRDNHYPGAACDVPSHLYSFASNPNPNWSHVFAPQREILDYIRDTAREAGVLDRIEFDREMLSAHWDAASAVWVIDTGEQTYFARALVSAVGHLSEPKFPALDGLADFQGELFHSAAWDDACQLAGKRVAVIGSGATGIQVVPAIAGEVGHLTVFQRSAPYITPRPDREYSRAEKRMFQRLPETMAAERRDVFWANEERYAQRRGTPTLIETVTNAALSHLAAQIPPGELRDKLTPDYTIGCKRILKADDYYPTFLLPHVALETSAIVRVESNGIRTADGVLHELDVIIACTGFEATDLPIAHRVAGRDGRLLSDAWSEGMQAFATSAVHGFPNFWLINGPNTGLGHNSAVYIAEAQINHITHAIQSLREGDDQILEVTQDTEEAYSAFLDRMSEGTVWLEGGCRNWYVDPRSNRLTTLWPDFAFSFKEVNAPFNASAYRGEVFDEDILGALFTKESDYMGSDSELEPATV